MISWCLSTFNIRYCNQIYKISTVKSADSRTALGWGPTHGNSNRTSRQLFVDAPQSVSSWFLSCSVLWSIKFHEFPQENHVGTRGCQLEYRATDRGARHPRKTGRIQRTRDKKAKNLQTQRRKETQTWRSIGRNSLLRSLLGPAQGRSLPGKSTHGTKHSGCYLMFVFSIT